MRKENEQPLKEVLKEMIELYRLRGKLNQSKIKATWEELMGPVIAKYTTDIRLRNQKLFLTITSAPLRQELSYGKDKIIKILNETLGENFIKDVIIR